MTSERIDLQQELEKYFGFDTFKGEQEEIIRSVLDRKDTFVIMPTGGGKSPLLPTPCADPRRNGNYYFPTYRFDEKSSGFGPGI